jgi:hypothetical protein
MIPALQQLAGFAIHTVAGWRDDRWAIKKSWKNRVHTSKKIIIDNWKINT